MSYPVCPSCGTDLSKRYIPFEESMKKICDDTKLSKEQVEKAVFELLDTLGIKPEQYCCRTRLLTYVHMVDIIM